MTIRPNTVTNFQADTQNPIKVQVIVDGRVVPNWKYRVLIALLDAPYVDVIDIYLTETYHKSIKHSENTPLKATSQHALYPRNISHIIERIKLTKKQSDPFKMDRDMRDILVISLAENFNTLPHCLNGTSEILYFGVRNHPTRYLAKGTGKIQHTKNSIIELALIVVDCKTGRKLTLDQAFSSTNRPSVLDDEYKFLGHAELLLLRHLASSTKNSDEYWRAMSSKSEPSTYSINPSRQFLKHSNFSLGKLAKAASTAWDKCLGLITINQWILLYNFSTEITFEFQSFHVLEPPNDRIWADPNVVHHENNYYIFFEELILSQVTGHISFIKITPDGHVTKPKTILAEPFHFSYPFLFQYEGQYFLIPESASQNNICIWRCVEFPEKWERQETILEGLKAYDTTLHKIDDIWWLFTNISFPASVSGQDSLYIFYAKDPINGPWTPHERNPVLTDCRNSRPAGSLFEHKNKLYRPAQNSSVRYGYSFNINRIDKLDPVEFQQTNVNAIEPNWFPNIQGTHTFSRAAELTVIDAQVRKFRFKLRGRG